MSVSRDLSGLLVVSVEQAVAAPMASGLLAAAGARVIKVERPEGDFARGYDRLLKGQSTYFVWLNQGKESVVLDLKEREDRDILSSLAARADVFIQNLKPGALARHGFSSEQLVERHPWVIACDISGFGSEGTAASLKAYDLIVQAETGLCSITGSPDAPARAGISICDIAAGATAHAAILQALIARAATGKGRAISVSLFDSLAYWMSVPLLQHEHGGRVARSGVSHPSIAPYGAFVTKDRHTVILAVQNEREWHRLCLEVLRRPELEQDPRFSTNIRRVANRDLLDDIVGRCFEGWSAEHILAALSQAGIACGRLNGLEDALAHPCLRRAVAQTPGGAVATIASPVRVAGDSPEAGRVPALGEHSDRVRKEFRPSS